MDGGEWLMKENTSRTNPPKPLLMIPKIPSSELKIQLPKQIEVFEYYAISDGHSRIFKEEDGVKELGCQVIPDPCMVSYRNLFINGVLQPKESYAVYPGVLILKTEDVPPKDAPVILQMFKV
jgi:hypothetical protein